MSKIKLLLEVVENLRGLADSVQAVADAMCQNEATAQSPAEAKTPQAPARPTMTLEEVRAALAQKSRLGFTEQVRALLAQHGANKLSEIGPGEYEALMKGAEEIGNG